MKHKPIRSDVKYRELPPGLMATPKGLRIICPFCKPQHFLFPGQESPCGTTIRVTAIQPYYPTHVTRSVHCLKCGKTGGTMVKYMNGYVHIQECAPDKKLLAEIPPLSNFARFVFHLPPKIRARFEKRTGMAKQLDEIDPEGKPTGKVLGYFFWKG